MFRITWIKKVLVNKRMRKKRLYLKVNMRIGRLKAKQKRRRKEKINMNFKLQYKVFSIVYKI